MTLALLFGRWNLSPLVCVGCGGFAAIYGMAASGAGGWPHRRTAAYFSGLAVIAFALQAGCEVDDDRLLSAHMVQHLLLIDLAPPLLLLGMPLGLLLAVLQPQVRVRVGRGLTRVGRNLSPAGCLVTYSLIAFGWHAPVLFTAALEHPLIHVVEHASFIVAGVLLWWPMLGSPNPRRMGVVARLLYLTVAMLPMTAIGAYLDRDTSLLYPVYAGPAHALGISALGDQQLAGAMMWVAGTVFMALLGLACVMAALLSAERRQRAREFHGVAP